MEFKKHWVLGSHLAIYITETLMITCFGSWGHHSFVYHRFLPLFGFVSMTADPRDQNLSSCSWSLHYRSVLILIEVDTCPRIGSSPWGREIGVMGKVLESKSVTCSPVKHWSVWGWAWLKQLRWGLQLKLCQQTDNMWMCYVWSDCVEWLLTLIILQHKQVTLAPQSSRS